MNKRVQILLAGMALALAALPSQRVIEAQPADNFNFDCQPKTRKSKGEKKRAAAQRRKKGWY